MAFYFYQDELYVAPTAVYAPDFELHADQHETYTYPVGGWYWFNSEQEAQAYFGIEPNEQAQIS